MTERYNIETPGEVVSMMMSYDSQYSLAMTYIDDENYEILGYSLNTYEIEFKVKI